MLLKFLIRQIDAKLLKATQIHKPSDQTIKKAGFNNIHFNHDKILYQTGLLQQFQILSSRTPAQLL